MSTFLVSLGVVAATIAAILYVALNGPDQPPTIRRRQSRDRPGRRRARPAGTGAGATTTPTAPARPAAAPLAPVGLPAGPALALPDSDPMHLRILPATPTTLWVRVRSGVALVVLVAVLGALLALTVGGLLVGIALLVRSATA